MPVNEFEKQVQQRLEELQLRPSPAVWTEVEKQIRKDKKRRRILLFWWLLPVLLTGGAISYYYFNDKGETTNIIATENNTDQPKQDQSSTTTGNTEQKEQNAPSTDSPDPAQDQYPAVKEDQPVSTPSNKSVTGQYQFHVSTSGPKLHKRPSSADGQKLELVNVNEPPPTAPIAGDNKDQKTKDQVPQADPVSPQKREIVVVAEKEPPVTSEDSAGKAQTGVITNNIVREENTLKPNDTDPIKLKRRKWQWGIALMPGLSNTRQGKLFSAEKDLIYATPNYVGSSPGTSFSAGPVAPPVLVSSPATRMSGGLEIFASKQIRKNLEFRAGLQYQFLRTSIRVGDRVEAQRQVNNDMSAGVLINSYYRAPDNSTGEHEYTNRYHLAGVTTSLSWKLINSKHFSLSWDNGIAVSQLIKTNALLFDGTLRSYYNDSRAFRKTQFSLSTGFSIPLMNRKTFTLSLSPSVSYGFTPVLKSGSEMNSHFVNYGLGLRFLFPR